MLASKVQDRYQSEMLIQIVPGRVPDRMVQNGIEGRADERMASLQAMVKSRSELEKLIKEFGLYQPRLAVMPLTDVVDIMRNDIAVEMVRSNRMLPPDSFNVRFTYTDPGVASRVTARLGSLFVDKNADERIELADNTREFIASISQTRRRGWSRTKRRWSCSASVTQDDCRRRPSPIFRFSRTRRHSFNRSSKARRGIAIAD